MVDAGRAAITMPLEETLRRLPPGAVDFARELFDHHWSEAAWLYARREVLHVQGNLVSSQQWLEIEARAAAHVAALGRGGQLVLDECEARIEDGDVGELHTAMRVLCRGNHVAAFDAALDVVEWPAPARAAAVADALTWDAPDAWQALVAGILADESAPEDSLGPLATVVGLRGWPLGDALIGVLEDRVGDLAATAEAVARLGVVEALPVLSELISATKEPPAVRCAAALAAATFDARAVAAYAGQLVTLEPWAAVPLAMTAGADALAVLAAALERWPGEAEVVLALGLLGHVDGIPRLLAALEDPKVAEAAAEALYLLTGAELHEETRLVEEPEPAEEEPEEGEEQGATEAEGSGLPVERLSQSRARWEAWLAGHGLAAQAGAARRLRLGVPFDPLRVVDELGRTTLRPALREMMAAELSVRYRVPRWYSSRWLVSRQRELVARMRGALAGQRVDAGAWVAGGVALRGGRSP